LEAQAVPGLAVFYRVSGFVHWHFFALPDQGSLKSVGFIVARQAWANSGHAEF
jgi:hypothetical protein